jgi:hypothetical protein
MTIHTQSWRTAVELTAAKRKWFVRVIENGVVTIKSFELETAAVAFAEEERDRLGLMQIARR